jgi:(1->4)-alpha-D-glucan 1-alpha-D-glucosylmutase
VRIPASTYRLQINADFTFAHVRELIHYFHDLGAGDLYFAPVFQARPKSPHGYDVTNPAQFNREVGDEAEFEALSLALRAAGMGVVLDIVPNHMAASEENPWWRDILEHGQASFACDFFDVEWEAPHCGSRIILPVLGRELDEALEDGELGVALTNGELVLTYFGRAFPLDPATYGMVLRKIEGMDPAIIAAADAIGSRKANTLQERERRRVAALELKKRIVEFPTVDAPSLSKEELRALIDQQAYRLEFWRSGTRRINYRRFFDITDLAGVRVEDPDVFATTHSLILDLLARNLITGVRVDHVDGLRDPGRYLQDLRTAIGDAYVVVEKILAPKEELRESWPIEGTTGYDFVGLLAGLYCEPEGLAQLTESYERRTGMPAFEDIVYEKKKLVIDALFAGELLSLATDLGRLAQALGHEIDHETLTACITEVSACLPVYRTYIGGGEIEHDDRCVVKNAVNTARHRAPAVPEAAYNLMRAVLLGEDVPGVCAERRNTFIASWQQFTGPVMAKSVEDTAFYTYNRLLALSEVGAHPQTIIASTREFHEQITNRSRKWPHTMNASSTHDTKRSEDVRARILVLSEMPDAWDQALERWAKLADRHKRDVNGHAFPEINEQIMIFQTLLGVWPLHEQERASLPDRLHAFLEKASREAKNHSSWIEPNEAYEKALFDFVDALLADERFLADFAPLRDTVAWYGALNSLSQTVVKLGAPGVPDIYQGNESWMYSLVDPDNRRPVDFKALTERLHSLPAEISAANTAEMLKNWEDGRIKMHVTSAALKLRRDNPQVFANGEYVGLDKRGRYAANVIPFARRHGNDWCLIAGGRFYSQVSPMPIGTAWADTMIELPDNAPRAWRNVLTGEVSDGSHVESVFATLPFAILTGI